MIRPAASVTNLAVPNPVRGSVDVDVVRVVGVTVLTWSTTLVVAGVRVTMASSVSVTVLPVLSVAVTMTMSVCLSPALPVKLPSNVQVYLPPFGPARCPRRSCRWPGWRCRRRCHRSAS